MSDLQIRSSGGAIGAEITGVDLTKPVDDADFTKITDALNEYAVVVIRDQKLTPAQLAAFARHFGTPQINVRAEANSGETPEVFWVSNVTKDGKPLGSHIRCHWKVRVWPALSKAEGDRDGKPSAWSEPATWSMGVLEPAGPSSGGRSLFK